MLQLLNRFKGIIVVGVLLAMPLVFLYAQTKRPGARGPVVGLFIDASALIERALLWSAGGLMDALEHYVTSVGSHEELVALRRSAQTAVRLRTRVTELELENEALRALIKAVEPIDGPRPLGARVIARIGAPLTRTITLDVGSADGVRRGDGVVDAHGVVGLVLAVGRRSCDVLLLTDAVSAIDVVVQRTRARGILRGAGSDDAYRARVEDFDKLRDVRSGDAVVTSGLGSRFPPGMLVGTVESAEAPDDSLYLRAAVRPAADFARVEHVGVLIDRPTPLAPRLGDEPAGPAADTSMATPATRKASDKRNGGRPAPTAVPGAPAVRTAPAAPPLAAAAPPLSAAAPPLSAAAPPLSAAAPPLSAAVPVVPAVSSDGSTSASDGTRP